MTELVDGLQSSSKFIKLIGKLVTKKRVIIPVITLLVGPEMGIFAEIIPIILDAIM